MKVKIIIFGSSWEASGIRELELDLTESMSVADFLEVLGEKAPFLNSYIRKQGPRLLSFSFVLIRGEEILKLNDSLHQGDIIKVLPPIVGG